MFDCELDRRSSPRYKFYKNYSVLIFKAKKTRRLFHNFIVQFALEMNEFVKMNRQTRLSALILIWAWISSLVLF